MDQLEGGDVIAFSQSDCRCLITHRCLKEVVDSNDCSSSSNTRENCRKFIHDYIRGQAITLNRNCLVTTTKSMQNADLLFFVAFPCVLC